ALQWLPAGAGGGAILAIGVGFVKLRRSLPLGSLESCAYLGLSVALAIGCALVATRVSRPGTSGSRRQSTDAAAPRIRFGLLDLVVPLLVVGLLYLPGWRQVAGDAFYREGSLHLDFFGLGPALAFRSGAALGTELHAYYGLGWGVVIALLDPLTYGNIIRLEVVYGCLYFSGVYLLLRVLGGDRRWAAVGTVLAVLLQMFAGYPADVVLWRSPSATIMRWPFDVWFFLACALHLRTGHSAWTCLAGATVALAVVFQTDTGFFLAAAFAFYWLCLWRVEGAQSLKRLAGSIAVAGLILCLGLGIAGRWTFLSGAFWAGWLENMRLSAAGGTLLPLTSVSSTWSITVFMVVTASYLAVVGYAALAIVARRIPTSTAMLGCIALYGFLTFLYFVGRSNPFNLFRPLVPFAILIAALGGVTHRAWAGRNPNGGRSSKLAHAAVPWVALAVAVAMLLANPGARAYPGLARTAVTEATARGVCLFEDPDDVCGLPSDSRQSLKELHALANRLRSLGSSTTSVAVLDHSGPVIQFMAAARPWGRYLPLFPSLMTRAQLRAVIRDLQQRPPPLVVMRSPGEAIFYADIWRELRVPVERDFVFAGREGPFEIWRRRAP
ncbi:MAG: hypothetical protein LC808_08495, partial [Actinobacteria bacterium]|nr:hypothetical protein [Actinomycetota bacterium]